MSVSVLAPARRRVDLVQAGLGVAAVAAGFFVLQRKGPSAIDSWDLLNTLVGWTFVGSGLSLWHRRPANRLGLLMVAVGTLWLAGRVLRQFSVSAAFTSGIFLGDLWTVVFIWVLLAFPDGRLTERFDRIVPIIALIVAGPLELIWLLFWKAPEGPSNALALWPNERIAGHVDSVQRFVLVVATIALSVVLCRRWLAASKPMRWALIPALAGAASLLVGASLNILDKLKVAVPSWLQWLLLLALAMVPVAVMAGVLRAHLARAGVANLLVQLRQNPSQADLRRPLARALGDPSLQLGYWLPKQDGYVDDDGQPIDLAANPSGRAVTVIERNGRQIAAIQHDALLRDEPELLDAVTAAAGIALENGQLHAELKARLDDLQDSRARVVQAGQTERRRLERNLHDGTQQRLVALSMELSILQRRLGDDPDAQARVEHAREEITASLAELRDVARGLYPAVLTVHGLPAALKSITANASVPVDLKVLISDRLPESVAVTGYYVVSECLANIGKHALASRATVDVTGSGAGLVVEVGDDGVGGAEIGAGSGLRGLADRVEALGGSFTVSNGSGRGTRVRAEIPYE
jgi:signal transduction histidine kinase